MLMWPLVEMSLTPLPVYTIPATQSQCSMCAWPACMACYYLLDYLKSIFALLASWVLPGTVDPSFHCPYVADLLLF